MNNPLLTEEIGVYLINMDTLVEEQVVCNEDGSFSIFINSRHSYGHQLAAYQHALAHIANNDFEKESADQIEAQAHAGESGVIFP